MDDDLDGFYAPIPDAVDRVVEVAGMMDVFAAQRLWRVEAMRQEALEDAHRHGRALTDVIERGVRLELAAALRITERATGEMIARAAAMVQRYPAVLDSLGRARMTERHAEILVDLVDEAESELRGALVPQAIQLAEQHPVGSFRRMLRRLIDSVRSVTLAERHEAALGRRRMAVEPDEDTMAWLHVYLPGSRRKPSSAVRRPWRK
nr:hypothetical protein GCM10025699_00250 [Microbacterium flavescens]BFF12495.1 hypothetical protein GCM10025699_37980 [Microbacterium flavescens]